MAGIRFARTLNPISLKKCSSISGLGVRVPSDLVFDLGRILHVDNANHIVGIVSESDLMYKVEPMSPALTYWQNPKRFEEEHRKIVAKNAAEIMTSEVITADENTSVEELATLMAERQIKRVPIVKTKELVGIVSRADIIKAIVRSPAAPNRRW